MPLWVRVVTAIIIMVNVMSMFLIHHGFYRKKEFKKPFALATLIIIINFVWLWIVTPS